ncbi:MAG: molybdopterin-dependent oxidoreductase [Chloroflexaceae bacterium]|jgi:carbon-monoxide dehydrogenase large subunit|nr:molybdopterin-dependent oxidoreductase [Chloroflexaceae bacterium]
MAYAKLIGAEVRRKEDPRLITGTGQYVGDLKLPGMLHVALVRSPYPHARIRSIDARVALKRPGVVAVITGQDLQASCNPLPMSGGEGGPKSKRTRPILSIDKVRHVGEAVAAVVATSPVVAIDAVAEVDVDWEPLPAVADMLKALEPDAPRLFEEMESNLDHVKRRKVGDPDAAFASAFKVVKQRMVNQRLCGLPMEGRAVVAMPDPMSGGLTVWTSTQAPHQMRGEIAKVLRMAENQVRVIAPDVGGGFGVKIGIYPEDALVAALARQFNAPVRWVEGRLEHMMATTHGRGQVADLEAAVTEDGTVTALRMRVIGDSGAYPVAPGIPDLTLAMGVGVYHVPNIDFEVTVVYTNTTPIAAYRGAGRPEAAYYLERMMDVIAAELGMDGAEVRRRNFIPPEAFPYKTPTGETYDSGEYNRALAKALDISNYAALREEQQQRIASGSNKLLGIGLATYVEMCGFGPYESAQVKVEPTGTVTVTTGISPHGQGGATTFAQIVADMLGVDFDSVVVKHGDTATTPMGIGTMGSRSIAVGGSALYRATERVREKARRIAATMLEANPADLELVDGHFQVRGAPDSKVAWARVVKRAYSDKLPDDISPGLEETDFFKPPELIYPFGAHVAVVEVDTDTGDVRIRNYYSVDDCGPRISPMLVNGQVHGGLAQGIAQALLEEVVYDENGQLLSGSLMDYAIPRADLFPPFTTDKTETPTPLNPLGAKGIGEAATIGSTPAIANAVADALRHLGVRHIDIPLRSEKVWRAMQGR